MRKAIAQKELAQKELAQKEPAQKEPAQKEPAQKEPAQKEPAQKELAKDSISGKGIFITDASIGLGEAAARQLAARDTRLAPGARREDRLTP